MFNCMTIHRCKQRRTRLCLLCMVACVTCILALFVGIGITLGLLLNKGDYAISAYNSVDYIHSNNNLRETRGLFVHLSAP